MGRLSLLIVAVLLAGCERASAPPARAPGPQVEQAERLAVPRIYSSLPHAGELRDVHLAAQLAFEQHGGGLEHIALDSARPDVGGGWEVGQVAANARRAAADPRAMAYVGEIASGASQASMPILDAAGLAQVAPGGPRAGLVDAENDHLVRVIPAEHLHAVAVVRLMRELGARRLVAVGDGEDAGKDMAAMVAANAAAAGIDVSEVTIDPHRLATIREVAEGVGRVRADTVYFGGVWQNRGVALWGRVHRAAPRARLIGSDGLAEPAFTEAIVRSSRARTYLTSVRVPPPKRFARAFLARFGHFPHPLAVYGHEAMRRAVRAVAAGTRRGVVNALFAAPGIDPDGEVTRGRFGVYRIKRSGLLEQRDTLVVSGG